MLSKEFKLLIFFKNYTNKNLYSLVILKLGSKSTYYSKDLLHPTVSYLLKHYIYKFKNYFTKLKYLIKLHH